MKLKVYSSDGAKAQEKDFALKEFEGKKGVQALKDAIVAYRASARQGNAKTKNFGEVKGTGKKPWRQKGTGNARHGSRRSPIWVKGAVVFGPRPRDWSVGINQKVRQLAFQRALFDKAVEGGLSLIEKITPAKPKTKLVAQVLTRIHPEGKILLIDEAFEKNAQMATRNIERVEMIDAASVNAWNIVNCQCVLVSEQGFQKILDRANA
jgi:large subunit ribosomal protein L4